MLMLRRSSRCWRWKTLRMRSLVIRRLDWLSNSASVYVPYGRPTPTSPTTETSCPAAYAVLTDVLGYNRRGARSQATIITLPRRANLGVRISNSKSVDIC